MSSDGDNAPGRPDGSPVKAMAATELGIVGKLPSPPTTPERIPPTAFEVLILSRENGDIDEGVASDILGTEETPMDDNEGAAKILCRPTAKPDAILPNAFCTLLTVGRLEVSPNRTEGVVVGIGGAIDEILSDGTDGCAARRLPNPPARFETTPVAALLRVKIDEGAEMAKEGDGTESKLTRPPATLETKLPSGICGLLIAIVGVDTLTAEIDVGVATLKDVVGTARRLFIPPITFEMPDKRFCTELGVGIDDGVGVLSSNVETVSGLPNPPITVDTIFAEGIGALLIAGRGEIVGTLTEGTLTDGAWIANMSLSPATTPDTAGWRATKGF